MDLYSACPTDGIGLIRAAPIASNPPPSRTPRPYLYDPGCLLARPRDIPWRNWHDQSSLIRLGNLIRSFGPSDPSHHQAVPARTWSAPNLASSISLASAPSLIAIELHPAFACAATTELSPDHPTSRPFCLPFAGSGTRSPSSVFLQAQESTTRAASTILFELTSTSGVAASGVPRNPPKRRRHQTRIAERWRWMR